MGYSETAPDILRLRYTWTARDRGLDDAIIGLAFDPDLSPSGANDVLMRTFGAVIAASFEPEPLYLGYVFRIPATPTAVGRVAEFTPENDSPSPSDDPSVHLAMSVPDSPLLETGHDVRFVWLYDVGSLPHNASQVVDLSIVRAESIEELNAAIAKVSHP